MKHFLFVKGKKIKEVDENYQIKKERVKYFLYKGTKRIKEVKRNGTPNRKDVKKFLFVNDKEVKEVEWDFLPAGDEKIRSFPEINHWLCKGKDIIKMVDCDYECQKGEKKYHKNDFGWWFRIDNKDIKGSDLDPNYTGELYKYTKEQLYNDKGKTKIRT